MTDHIIKAAKDAGATRAYPEAQSSRDDAYLVGQQFLERFYAIAYRQGMERAAEICEGQHEEDRPGDYAYAIRAEAHAQNQTGGKESVNG